MKLNAILLLTVAAFFTACDSGNGDTKIDASSIETNNTADNPNAVNKEPVISFEEKEWDFGTLTDGERVSHTFNFTNTGQADLLVSNCTASCGCTIPVWPKHPIKPGEKGEIKVEFNSTGKVGNVVKDINVIANTNPVQTILKIKIQVNPAQ